MSLLPDTKHCALRMRWECRERFPRHRGLAIPTCITARAWRMTGSLTSGFPWSRLRGKRTRTFPAHAQPASLRIWQEVHVRTIQHCTLFCQKVINRVKDCMQDITTNFEINKRGKTTNWRGRIGTLLTTNQLVSFEVKSYTVRYHGNNV